LGKPTNYNLVFKQMTFYNDEKDKKDEQDERNEKKIYNDENH
jgi:hypothetical protein